MEAHEIDWKNLGTSITTPESMRKMREKGMENSIYP